MKSEGAIFVGQFSVVKEHIVPFTLMCKKSGDMGHPVPFIGGETQCASNIWPKSKENGGFAHPKYGPNYLLRIQFRIAFVTLIKGLLFSM